jgi:hypothetical protein
MTKQDIQGRYLRGEINHDAYRKLLGRLEQVGAENEYEEKERREKGTLQQRRNAYLMSDRYKQRTEARSANSAPPLYGSKK